jgi:hypothetical protein
MDSRDFFVLAIVELGVVLAALLSLLAVWVLSPRDSGARMEEPTRLEAKPQQPFLVWVNSLPRLGQTPTAPLRPLRRDGFSVHVRQ